MTRQTRNYLKNVFKLNNIPTEQDFHDFIDSNFNITDDVDNLNINTLQVNNKITLGEVSVTKIAKDLASNPSDSAIPTQLAVKTYTDSNYAKLNGATNSTFTASDLIALNSLSLNGQSVSKISISTSDFSNISDSALMTEKGVINYVKNNAPTKVGNLTTVKDLTLTGQFQFAASGEPAIKSISTDVAFKSPSDNNLASQLAVKTYVDNSLSQTVKAITEGDPNTSFSAKDLKLSGALSFSSSSQSINRFSDDATADFILNSSNSHVPTEKAVGNFVMNYAAKKAGDSNANFQTKDLAVSGDLLVSKTLTLSATGQQISSFVTSTDADFTSTPTDTNVPTEKAVGNFVVNYAAKKGGDSTVDFLTKKLDVNTNLTVTGTFRLGTKTVDKIADDFQNPSSSALVTQVAIKNYVDTQTSTSDIRVKKDVQNLQDCLSIILSLQGVSFEWLDDSKGSGRRFGFIAQEVENVLPEIVREDHQGYKSVAYIQLISILTEAIKEQQSQIKDLKEQINLIKSKN